MANGYSDYQIAVRAAAAGSLHTRALQNQVMAKSKHILLSYQGLGTELNSQFVDLGSPDADGAQFIPESLRIRHGGTGNFSVPVKFAKLTTVEGTIQNHRAFNCTWTRSSATITVTTPEPHGFCTNQVLKVANTSSAAAVPNGCTGIIQVQSPTTFTFIGIAGGDTSGSAVIGETVSPNITGTYTRSTTTVTVTTQGSHGFSSSDILNIVAGFDVLSMPTPGALGLIGVITVTGVNTFTFVCTDAGAASGSITVAQQAGNVVPLTGSVAYTQAAIYTGAAIPAATTTVTPIGLGDVPVWRKEDKLVLIWGVITTVPPVTRVFYIQGTYADLR